MKFEKFLMVVSLSLSFALTGCGKVTPVGEIDAVAGNGFNLGGFPYNGGNGNGNGGGNPTDDGNETENKLDPYSYSFEVAGAGGIGDQFLTPSVDTDTTLKVKITAGPAGILRLPTSSGYSGASASYTCVRYRVAMVINGVEGQSFTTAPLAAVPGGCQKLAMFDPSYASAKNFQIKDLSLRLNPGQNGDIKIKISNVAMDYQCQLCLSGYCGTPLMPGSPADYCPMKPMYKNHTAGGIIEIETNDTRAVK